MKAVYFLIFMTFFAIGSWRAFSHSSKVFELTPRQTAEVVYRNTLAAERFWATNENIDANYEESQKLLKRIVDKNPFMNRQDQRWVNSKIRDLKNQARQVVVLKTVQK